MRWLKGLVRSVWHRERYEAPTPPPRRPKLPQGGTGTAPPQGGEPRTLRFPARAALPPLDLDDDLPPVRLHGYPRLYRPELLTGDVEVMVRASGLCGDGEGI